MKKHELTRGSLLVAAPEVDEDLFFRSVLLICEHNPTGSFGLIINKPLHADLPDEILPPSHIKNPNLGLRAAGPVQPGQMMLLHTSNSIPDQTMEICDGVHLGGDLEFLHSTAGNIDGPEIYLCFGYTGWGPDALEQELLAGMWYPASGSLEQVFKTPPETLWRKLLAQMGGKFASLSMMPENLDLN